MIPFTICGCSERRAELSRNPSYPISYGDKLVYKTNEYYIVISIINIHKP